jgi:hypothetical protein
MRRLFYLVFFSAACLVLFSGCGEKKAGQLTSAEAKAFEQAAAEAKQQWTSAVEATRTNDYVGAQTLLFGLMNQELSADQKAAVSKQMGIVNDNLYAALEKGDPEAQKAMEELRRNPPNRPK